MIVSRVSCAQTSLRIPLSAKGLRGGAHRLRRRATGARSPPRCSSGFAPSSETRSRSVPLPTRPTCLSPRDGFSRARSPSPRRARRRSPSPPCELERQGESVRRKTSLPVRQVTATTFPLIPRRRVLGLPFGALHSAPPRPRLGRRRLASVPAGRRHRPHRLVRVGAAVARARLGRVRRPRALRRGGAARRLARRPPAVDVDLPRGLAVAAEAGGDPRRGAAHLRQRDRRPRPARLPRRGRGRAVLAPAAQPAPARRRRPRAAVRGARGHARRAACTISSRSGATSPPARSSSSSPTSSSGRAATNGCWCSSAGSRSCR